MVVLAPYLFLDRIIAPGADAINYYYPAFYWYGEALKNGDSFLWNPTILSGFPSYLSQVSGYLEPLNMLLFSSLPFLFAYHIRLAIDMLLVSLFSYLVARRWGISKLAAFFIGPTYLMSFHWWYLSNTVIVNSLFLLPFLFWVYVRARDAQGWRRFAWAVFGGLGVGWAFLGGYAQFIVYVLVFVGLYALYDFFFLTERQQRSIRLAAAMCGVLAVFASLGFVVGSPQILAALAYTPQSVRSGGLDYAATQLKVLDYHEAIFFMFPDYLRFPLINGGKKTLFIGVFSFLCAIVAMLHVRRQRYALPLFALFAFALLVALPKSPLHYALHQLPVFELFRFPYRWMYLGAWTLAVLGAIGFDLLRRGELSPSSRYLGIGAIVAAASLTIVTLLASIGGNAIWGALKAAAFQVFHAVVYSPDVFPKGIDHYQGSLERAIDAWRVVLSLNNPYYAVPFFSFVAACVILFHRTRGHFSQYVFEKMATTLLVATFVGVFAVRWADSLPSSVLWGANILHESIPESDRDTYRMHPFHPGASFVPRHTSLIWSTEDTNAGVELAHALAVPNVNAYANLSLTDGYEPFISRDLLHIMAVRLGSTYTSQDELQNVTLSDRRELLLANLDLVSFMAGKYVLSGVPLEHDSLRLKAVPRGSSYDTPVYVYENGDALPRVYWASQAESVPHGSVRELLDGGYRLGKTAYLDCDDCATNAQGLIEVTEASNGYFALSASAEAPGWVVISEQMLPGWYATIDDTPVEIVRANGMYMAVPVPEGEHEIVLQYEGIRGEASWLYPLGLFPRPPLHEVRPRSD